MILKFGHLFLKHLMYVYQGYFVKDEVMTFQVGKDKWFFF